MAEVAMRMTAHGVAGEVCTGCNERFQRGEQMTAVAYDGGDPAGWFCAGCLSKWGATGVEPKPKWEDA